MSLEQQEIKLHNGKRVFTTLSNLSQTAIVGQKFNRVIFLFHGFPDVNTTFNKIWPLLIDHYNSLNEPVLILAPKLRGYEKSSIGPEGEYMLPYLADDVKAWIHEVNPELNKPVNIVGHDWGAILGFKFANMYPDLVTSMVCMAIPYLANVNPLELVWYAPEQLYLSTYFFTMQYAYFYKDKLTQDNEYLTKLWKYWSPGYKATQAEINEIRETFAKDGVVDAVTAYYRHLFRPFSLKKSRWPVDFTKVPTLVLMGEDDGCMSKKLAYLEERKLKQYGEKAKVKLLPQAGHFLQREQPKIVADLVVEFLDQWSK